MTLARCVLILVPCVLLAYGASAAAAKKQGAQMSITTFKYPSRQAARPALKRTTHRPDAPPLALRGFSRTP